MDTSLRTFVKEFAGVVAAVLMGVAVIAFLSVPASLGRHPGHARGPDLPASWHPS